MSSSTIRQAHMRCIGQGTHVDKPAKASWTYPYVSEWSWILREETKVWSSKWTVLEDVSNVWSLLFIWNCGKRCTGNCNSGEEIIRCWPTAGAGNLFRARTRWDFPEQLVDRSDKMRMYRPYITILLLQSRQISETAGSACHEEVFQCPARWMISTTE